MVFRIVGLSIAFILLIVSFILYARATEKIIKDLKRENARLRTQLIREKHRAARANQPKPISAEDLKINTPVYGDAK